VLVTFPLGLFVALALNEKFRFRAPLRLTVVLPWIIPYVSAAVMWRFLLLYPFGHFDFALRSLGIVHGGSGVLTSSPAAMIGVIAASVWRFYPFVMTMLLAGLQGVPLELYDAAKVDGAGPYRRFVHITLPQMLPTIMVVLLILTTWSMNAFSIIYLMTGGGPSFDTEIYSLYIYRKMFSQYQFGESAAASVILFLLGLIVSVTYVQWVKKTG
jgi:ABC-type sugar transport system permease subunit